MLLVGLFRTITQLVRPRLYQKDYDQFAAVDTPVVWTQFPAHIDVLTLHGLKDTVVPPYDAFIYSRAYGARSPGTHILRYVEEADHNFTGVRPKSFAGYNAEMSPSCCYRCLRKSLRLC